jgi:20S proteasome alpha/beta subunit
MYFLSNGCLLTCCLGKGVVYSFDPVGSYERQVCRAGGSAAALIQPFLDNQVYIYIYIYMNMNIA